MFFFLKNLILPYFSRLRRAKNMIFERFRALLCHRKHFFLTKTVDCWIIIIYDDFRPIAYFVRVETETINKIFMDFPLLLTLRFLCEKNIKLYMGKT